MIYKNVLLADDDQDDCMLFEDALKEVPVPATLQTARNGQLLMDMLHSMSADFPDVVFLDLNMPRKNGLECLEEIRQSDKLKDIPVVIFSTTAQQQSVSTTYEKGANYYIQKPSSFANLKKVIQKVLEINWDTQSGQPPLQDFLLHPDNA